MSKARKNSSKNNFDIRAYELTEQVKSAIKAQAHKISLFSETRSSTNLHNQVQITKKIMIEIPGSAERKSANKLLTATRSLTSTAGKKTKRNTNSCFQFAITQHKNTQQSHNPLKP